jgi:hypothetical protein
MWSRRSQPSLKFFGPKPVRPNNLDRKLWEKFEKNLKVDQILDFCEKNRKIGAEEAIYIHNLVKIVMFK